MPVCGTQTIKYSETLSNSRLLFDQLLLNLSINPFKMAYMLYLNIGILEVVLLAFAVLFPIILIIYCLLDITRSNFQDSANKIIWAIIVLLAPVIGSLAYLIWGRKQKTITS